MNKTKTILSIILGRHRLGYAVIYQNMLIYYGIVSFSTFKTKDEVLFALERFLKRIIKRFEVDKVAVRKLVKSQEKSMLLREIQAHLKIVCRDLKINIRNYESKFINQHFCTKEERPTKEKTMITLTAKYPELKRYQNLKKEWQKRYYASLFQAIALGLVCLAEINNKEKGKWKTK
jgi:Holliday junction resolvasome RuvABC endonuclease subunit